MQIKLQLGKLRFDRALAEIVSSQERINNLTILPIALAHVLALNDLPAHHKDPFDRLLVAQSIVENATLVSNDPQFAKYSLSVVW
jgi:PIN domain nuclease of toxin-antitoxin system